MNIYFMGIGGTAMGNTALLLKKQGHTISGSDGVIYPPMSNLLEDAGIEIHQGYSPERLASKAPQMVVIGNALSRGNEEIEWLLESNTLAYCSLPQLLQRLILKDRKNIVITGTHGKTTTSSIASYFLIQNQADPGYLIGGVPQDLPSGAHLGALHDPFVIEGDEYDSAFFDKRSKFIHYSPHILAINNLEFDHADIFRDIEDIRRTFNHVTRLVPRNGFILINGDDHEITQLDETPWATTLKVGFGAHNDLQIDNFTESLKGADFDLIYKGAAWGHIHWDLPGAFNACNCAMAALSAALSLFPENPTQLELSSLEQFKGVKRRQEILMSSDALTVIEDFAHHPTSVRETLQSLKAKYPEHTITACFEPRSSTAKSKVFQNEFTQALSHAGCAYIGEVNSSLEKDMQLDTNLMALSLNQSGIKAQAFESNEALLSALNSQQYTHNQVICFLTNGSFSGIMQAFVDEQKLAIPC